MYNIPMKFQTYTSHDREHLCLRISKFCIQFLSFCDRSCNASNFYKEENCKFGFIRIIYHVQKAELNSQIWVINSLYSLGFDPNQELCTNVTYSLYFFQCLIQRTLPFNCVLTYNFLRIQTQGQENINHIWCWWHDLITSTCFIYFKLKSTSIQILIKFKKLIFNTIFLQNKEISNQLC